MKSLLWLTLLSVGLTSFGEEDTPVLFTDMTNSPAAYKPLEGSTPWQAPDYSKQESAIGYNPDTFQIPKGMEDRVQFWKRIYTEFTTDQGLFHDSLYTNVIYEPVDMTPIMKDITVGGREKEKARHKLVEATRKVIRERLLHLDTLSSPEGLEGEDLRYWHMFENIDMPHKFKEAAQEGRLRFQLGQKDRFIQGIYQSGRYLAQMEQIFREEGLPAELTRLPFVESSFNLKARSRVGASGIWQFMRYAARPYMKINAMVDERNDPLRATRAAAKSLRFNYRMLEDWPLAVTAYNHGPNGVKRLVDKFQTRNLVELLDVRKGRFGFASASFYASFLAALEVEREALVHFGLVYRMPELKGHEIVLKSSTPVSLLVETFNGNIDLMRDLNPHLLERVWKGRFAVPAKTFIRVPEDRVDETLARLTHPAPKTSTASVTDSEGGETYIVTTGDTLSGIATQFGVRVRDLVDANDLVGKRGFIRAGQKILIPTKVR